MAELYGTNVILMPWGDDFRFVEAAQQFSNMDLLIDYVNEHPELGVRVQYSTLSRYFAALHRTEKKFPSFVGDFFPYADMEGSYWTVSTIHYNNSNVNSSIHLRSRVCTPLNLRSNCTRAKLTPSFVQQM